MNEREEAKQINVILADNQELFREGLCKLLEARPHIKVVCQCDNGPEVVEMAKLTNPDVVVMGSQMPDGDGVETAEMLIRSMPNIKVAMLTNCEDSEELFSAFKAGVTGYLLNTTGVDELVKSVELIAKGDVVVSPPLAGKLLMELALIGSRKRRALPGAGVRLSEREREILQYVVRGSTNKEIAETLIITENTAKVHMKNILEKLQLRNKQQAAAWAVEHGLVDGIGLQERQAN